MSMLPASVLEAVLKHLPDPVIIVNSGHSAWPISFANAAFRDLAGSLSLDGPVADMCETLLGRTAAVDVSEAIRRREPTRIPVEIAGRECILDVSPLVGVEYVVIYLLTVHGGGLAPADAATAEALLKAKRRIRDLDRDDSITGLLNERGFRDILAHDWAVAAREKNTLTLVRFQLVDFDAYEEVFGRHASNSCLRRVGRAIKRSLRRASDIVARFDDDSLVVLSHASDEASVRRFADSIAASIRELQIHHPRSSEDRFVTLEQRVLSTESGGRASSADLLLDKLLS